MDDLLARDVMSPRPIAIPPTTSVRQAAQRMREAGAGSLLAVENGKPVGILTERDLVTKVLAAGADPESTPIRSVMSTPLLTIPPTTPVVEAARIMARRGVRRLPVSDAGRLVGLLTERDILAVSPMLAEITRATVSPEESEVLSLTHCDVCRGLTDGTRRIDGQVVCDGCWPELRAR
ncbi:MAG TPA: CBS domain-containing protein [Candidatus Thermoplasmatota archaeon]|nr:CBS domain-containing protein [Candidatus Thermoplasmatota archaeon]